MLKSNRSNNRLNQIIIISLLYSTLISGNFQNPLTFEPSKKAAHEKTTPMTYSSKPKLFLLLHCNCYCAIFTFLDLCISDFAAIQETHTHTHTTFHTLSLFLPLVPSLPLLSLKHTSCYCRLISNTSLDVPDILLFANYHLFSSSSTFQKTNFS